MIGGWLAAPGVCDLLLAFEPRWSAWRILLQHQALAVGLILLAVVRAWSEFNPANPLTWLYVGGMAGFGSPWWGCWLAWMPAAPGRRARTHAG